MREIALFEAIKFRSVCTCRLKRQKMCEHFILKFRAVSEKSAENHRSYCFLAHSVESRILNHLKRVDAVQEKRRTILLCEYTNMLVRYRQ